MVCLLCKDKRVQLVYDGIIRSGLWGSFTDEKHKAYRCLHCGVEFIHPKIKIVYENETYRKDYNASEKIENYYQLHDKLQFNYIDILTGVEFRNKTVCDLGSGGGAFLDFVKGLAKKTYAVEPFTGYQSTLKKRGHDTYTSAPDLIAKKGDNFADVVTSFHVIEHVDNPLQFVKNAYQLLKKGGVAYIVTPNSNDILSKFGMEEFNKFYYRTVHAWYLNQKSFEFIASKVGLKNYEIGFQQNYDLSNFALWMKDKEPTGNNQSQLFDKTINASWKVFLEQSGMADTIIFKFTK